MQTRTIIIDENYFTCPCNPCRFGTNTSMSLLRHIKTDHKGYPDYKKARIKQYLLCVESGQICNHSDLSCLKLAIKNNLISWRFQET